jgi:HlyD family secretion protein
MLWAAGILLLAGFAVALWPKPVPVDSAEIASGPMAVTIDEEGRTRIKDIYTVSAPVGGHLRRPSIEVGDEVEAGTTALAVIEPSVPPFLDARTRAEIEASLEAANAAVTGAEADLVKASSELSFVEDDLKRARRLAKTGTIPQRRLDETEHRAEAARMSRTAAAAAVEVRKRERDAVLARLNKEPDQDAKGGDCCVTIRAPASGRVLEVMADSARDIAAGTPIVKIGDPANLEIVVELLSSDAVQVAEGAFVTIDSWGGPTALQGKVARIEPSGFTKVSALGIEEQRVRVLVTLASPPEARLGLGHDFRVYARIASWSSASVLQVPIGALFRDGSDWAVYRIASGKAEITRIAIGHRNSDVAEVLSGLNPGDRVILHPSDTVADGIRIRERGAN